VSPRVAAGIERAPVTDADLRPHLERALGARVAALRRRPLAHASSYEIEALDALAADGWSRRFVLKRVGEAGLVPAAVGAKPEPVLDRRREIDAYRDLLDPLGLGAPRLHGFRLGPESESFWLLLEWIDGEPLGEVGDRSAWERTARWLARLHLAPVPRSLPASLLRLDGRWFGTWLDRALSLAPAGALDRIVASHGRVVRRLLAWPAGLVHGELFPSNVLVERCTGRIRVVDWEMAAAGPGVLDLAALVAGGWTASERDGLVRAYHDERSRNGGRGSLGDLVEVLEHARLALAVQRLGWSDSWSPPEEHAHDWLAEALRAAERLGL
jgi:aminoglycoside phosphotransferase (APT) family kinase protein